MLEPKAITLTGNFIQLEPLQEEHRATLRELSRDEKTSTFSPALRLKFDSWFDKALKNFSTSQQVSFIVRTIADQKIVGSSRFYEIEPSHARLAIGYTWYIPAVWGTVVNAECKLLLLQYAFDTLRANRIEFAIDSRNERSRAAVKKLGATEEGLLRQHILLDDGHVRDTVIASIVKEEWPAILSNLNKRLSK